MRYSNFSNQEEIPAQRRRNGSAPQGRVDRPVSPSGNAEFRVAEVEKAGNLRLAAEAAIRSLRGGFSGVGTKIPGID